jgi:PAS domain S-box-containing protein
MKESETIINVEKLKNLQKLAAFVETSIDAIIGLDLKGVVSGWNLGAEMLFGYSREEMMGKPLSLLLPPDHPNEIEETIQKIKQGKDIKEFETVRLRKDGKKIHVSITYSPLKDSDGSIIGLFSIDRDIHQLKETREELAKASRYTRSLLEANIDPLITISAEGKINDVNEATIKVTGIERKKIIGTDFSNYFTDPVKAKAGYQQVFLEGSLTDYELEFQKVNGEITPVSINLTLYRDDDGEVVGVFASARDISDLRQAEEALSQAITPVMKVWDEVLMLPLVGTVDSKRAQVVMETMLTNVMENRIKVAILDVMGVPIVDSAIAGYIVKVVNSTRLMGCECIISGISPNLAQTLVNLGLELGDVTKTSNLADALQKAFDFLNLEVNNIPIRR